MLTIKTVNLTKEFKSIKALDNVSIDINEGELFGLLGPNGAGKTTLLKILSCVITPNGGEVSVMGYDTVAQEQKVKSLIGTVTGDERSFYWRLTGRQNLTFFGSLYNLSSRQIKSRISQLAEFLGIESILDRKFMEYSTGTKQLFAIARALLHDPHVLLFDEPTKSLDPGTAEKIRRFIKEELVGKQHKTILLTTHQIQEAENICDRIAIIVKGKIRTCLPVSKLKEENTSLEAVFNKIVE
jgi:ABC-2 type transport system ATP-binding protein